MSLLPIKENLCVPYWSCYIFSKYMSYFVDMMGGMGNGSGGSNIYGSGMSYQGQSGYRPPMTSRQY